MFQKKRTKPNKVLILGGLVLFFCLVSNLAFAAAPTVGTVSPSSGSTSPNLAKTFTCKYSDADGWANLKEAYLLISASSTALANSVYLYYDQNSNLLYVRNDANSAWLGGYAPASSNTIQNSQVTLNCSSTTISGSTNTMTVNWNITFKPAYSGKAYNSYLYVKDDTGGIAGWTSKGTYTVNSAPALGTITPSSGTGQVNSAQVFTATFSDPDGWQNIQYVYFLVSTASSNLTNCLYVYYNQNTNLLYLRNDANTAWLGGYAPGSTNTIENSYAKLNCAATTVTGAGNTMTVNWSVSFKTTFTGAKKAYLYVIDDVSASVNWTQKGTWTIQQADTTPPTGTIKINNLATYTKSTSVTLTLSATDSGSGMGSGAQMQFSNDNSTWSTPEAYATSKTWTLTSGDGTKTVSVKYKDVAGNWSNPISSTIILDTLPPRIVITSPLPNFLTNQPAVSLDYTVDGVRKSDNRTLSEGLNTLTVTTTDLAGNSASQSITGTLDTFAPVVIITAPKNGAVIEDSTVQLQGTVDSVAFSEPRTLTPGDNTLTKTATDAAGNSGSASISVYLYTGTLIGPDGGQVSSPDGKVKVTIPQGALTSPQQIEILTVDTNTLQGTQPSGTSLLSVVDCKPHGLVFNLPVSIVYSLAQAEIPGTPVELGLYDSVQNKIISTGQTSTVPADGYTLTFSIMHFSTYAALENLIPQSAPIGSGVKIPLPDLLTGAFGHAIPITVPPGRKGIQPGLSLSYRSSNSNSWVGLGYSLNPGYIVRSTRLGPPTYNDVQDTFYFVTDAGTTELVNLVDNLYQAKVESSFTKFYKESDDSWRAVGKDGSVLRFGQSADSKETSTSGTFAWYITKVTDTNGNYIGYNYTKDQGKSYLSRIDYTGNDIGVAPTNSVEFILETRNDIASSYISTAKIVTARRLKEIQVKLNSELVWRYELVYAYSQDTDRSLLTSITQFAADSNSLPVQRFSYQQAK